MKLLKKIRKAFLLIYKRPKGFKEYCLGLVSALFKSEFAFGMPVHITIEPTNICNLRCPVCETGSGILNRTQAMMYYEDFKLIIDKIYKHANSIFFYHMGEPFLNPDSYKMIRYAKTKGLYITTCTNGQFVDAKQLVESGIDEVIFQIGGVSDKTHTTYRVGSNLGQIIQNVKNVLKEKRSLRRPNPKVILGFIVMKHNESEIDKFYQLAKEICVDEARIFNPRVRTKEQGEQFLPHDLKYWIYSRQDFIKGKLKPKYNSKNRCNWIYISTVISVNGDIVPCCRDFNGNFVMGNILKDGFQKIWNSPEYRSFRKKVACSKKDISICELCDGFELSGLYKDNLEGSNIRTKT